MNNNGFYGIKNLGGMFDNVPSPSPSTNAGIGATVGSGLQVVGTIMDIFNQVGVQESLAREGQKAQQQFDMQIKQINNNQNIANLSALKQANTAYAKLLAMQSTNNISASSSIGMTASNQISNEVNTMDFSSNMTATTQKLNTYLQASSYYRQLGYQLKSSENQLMGSALSGGAAIASLVALLV